MEVLPIKAGTLSGKYMLNLTAGVENIPHVSPEILSI
jgi:hypothetical protein